MGFTKDTSSTTNISDLPDQPLISATALKAAFDKYSADDVPFENNLIDELESVADGSSGMDNVGMTPIDSIMITPQQSLEYLKGRVDATQPTLNIYSVLDNGLVGNGVANDATQLNTLIASIGSKEATIVFPALTTGQATYLISTNVVFPENINLEFLNGATLKVSNTFSVTGTKTKINAGLYQIFDLSLGGTTEGLWSLIEAYPQWFGAKSDGITDDATSIQNTIKLVGFDGAVYIPRTDDNYIVGSTLQMRPRTHIYSNKAILEYTGTGTCLNATQEDDLNENIYPRVTGLTIKKKDEDKIGVGMRVQQSKIGGRFVDCDFFGFEYGVYHSDLTPHDTVTPNVNQWAWLNTFEGCRFARNKYGSFFGVNSNGVSVDKCFFYNNEFYGAKIFDSQNIRITNGEFENNGLVTTGHAILIDDSRSILISANYMESNGFNDTDSAVIEVGSSIGFSYQPQITNNYMNCIGSHTGIKLKEVTTAYITGNYFYDGSPPTYDIDISEMNSTIESFIMGNKASATSGKFNYLFSNVSSSSWMAHSTLGFVKETFALVGDETAIKLSDDSLSQFVTIKQINNRTKFLNKDDVEFFSAHGGTKRVSLAIESGNTAARPASPYAVGQMYLDTTIDKPIWWNGATWWDATGTVV